MGVVGWPLGERWAGPAQLIWHFECFLTGFIVVLVLPAANSDKIKYTANERNSAANKQNSVWANSEQQEIIFGLDPKSRWP